MYRIKIHASPEQVYQALTTAEGIRNWWTRDAGTCHPDLRDNAASHASELH